MRPWVLAVCVGWIATAGAAAQDALRTALWQRNARAAAAALDAQPKLVDAVDRIVGWTPPLLLAVRLRQPALVALLLDRGADARAVDGEGHDALSILLGGGSPRQAEATRAVLALLLARTVDVNRPSAGVRPLERAVRRRLTPGVQRLLAAGAKPALYDPRADPPLLVAVAQRNTATVQALLDGGADPRQTHPQRGMMAIHVAAAGGAVEIVDLLLARTAGLATARSADQQTPLHHAALARSRGVVVPQARYVEIARKLVAAGADLAAVDRLGRTPLLLAARAGKAQLVTALAGLGASLTARDRLGKTAAWLAAEHGRGGVTRALAALGVRTSPSPMPVAALAGALARMTAAQLTERLQQTPSLANATNRHDETLLSVVAGRGRADLARVLLDAGARPDARNRIGHTTALHRAAEGGHREALELLIARGATPDLVDGDGRNAFELALRGGHTALCDVLYARAVRPPVPARPGATLLHLAVTSDRPAWLRALLERLPVNHPDAAGRTALHLAATHASLGTLRLLLLHGASRTAVDAAGRTALHHVCRRAGDDASRAAIAQALIAAGAPADRADADGQTPLMRALAGGQATLARTLVAAGASLTARDSRGGRPLHHALDADTRATRLALARWLLSRKADPTVADAAGIAPLHQAAARGDAELVALLLGVGVDPLIQDALGRRPIDRTRDAAVRAALSAAARR